MKRIVLLFLTSLALSSCSVTYLIGDITFMDAESKTIGVWNNAIIQSSISTTNGERTTFGGIKNGGGINFIDAKNETHYISGGIISVGNLRKLTENEYNLQKAEPLVKRYKLLKKINEQDKKDIKTINKDTDLYFLIKERITKVSNEMRDIAHKLYMEYKLDIDLLP